MSSKYPIALLLFLLAQSASAQSERTNGVDLFEDEVQTSTAGDHWSVWTTAGVGVATFGIGLTLYFIGSSEYDELARAGRDNEGRIRTITQQQAARDESQALDRSNLGAALMGAGVLLGLTASALYYGLDGDQQTIEAEAERQYPFGFVPSYDVGSGVIGLNYGGLLNVL